MISVLLDLKTVFVSVDRAIVWHCFFAEEHAREIKSLLQFRCANNQSRIRLFGYRSPMFAMKSGV